MIKRLLTALAVLGMSAAGFAPTAVADTYPPVTGYKVDYNVTATTNGVPTDRPTIIDYSMKNVVSCGWIDVNSTPWHFGFHWNDSSTCQPQPGVNLNVPQVSAKPTNPNPVWGVVTYSCSISVNDVVVASNRGVGSVSCAL